MPAERFSLNPRLITNSLGSTGFVIYSPPRPQPLRFSSSDWLLLSALANKEFTKLQLQQSLTKLPEDYESFEQYLQWLLSKDIILPVNIHTQEVLAEPLQSLSSLQGRDTRLLDNVGDTGESNSIHLFTCNPSWPDNIRSNLLHLLRLQIWLLTPMLIIVVLYLSFFLLTPSPNALYLLGVGPQKSNSFDVLSRMLIALLSVNLLSTAFSWLTQSITGLGDGRVVLRFLFGFIPRFGVNSYKGPAFKSHKWTKESDYALLCVAQPLLIRLSLASFLIVFLSSGRLHNGFSGSYLYYIGATMLDISLLTALILALPFRKSPGYRLMILLTNLPPNILGLSIRHLFQFMHGLVRFVFIRDRSAQLVLKNSVSSWRDLGLIVFALLFLLLLITKSVIILFVAIPRLAADLPSVFGESSEYLFAIVLFALFIRFASKSILPKLQFKRNHGSVQGVAIVDDSLDPISLSPSQPARQTTKSQYSWFLTILISLMLLLLPINRTVTGSVLVSTERDLTVRAPADVRIIKIFENGPSTQVIPAGRPLIQLQSQQIDYDLYSTETTLEQLKSELNTLTEQSRSNRDIMNELRASLVITKQAEQVLQYQLKQTQSLIQQGGLSKIMGDDILLRAYDEQATERIKLQQILELQSNIATADLKIKSTQNAIRQSENLLRSLLDENEKLNVSMPFDGLITSSTSGLMWSFVSKGESLLDLKEGSLNIVNVLIPDHDRSILRVDQKAEIRLYAEPSRMISGFVKSIRPTSEMIDDQSFFQASIRLVKPLSPQLLQSSGAARINTGTSNLFFIILSSIGRFIRVDLWSWTP